MAKMSEQEKDEFIDGFMVTVLNAVAAWFKGKASIMVGELPIRFKADDEPPTT